MIETQPLLIDQSRLPKSVSNKWGLLKPGAFILFATLLFLQSGAVLGQNSSAWTKTQFGLRVKLTLPSISSARSDVPVFLDLDAYSQPISGVGFAVVDQSGPSPVDVSASAYSQPDGTERTLFFVAKGTIASGASKDYYLYFDSDSQIPPWDYRTLGDCSFTSSTTGSGGSFRRFYTLNAGSSASGGRLSLQRSSMGESPALLYGRNGDSVEYSHLKDLNTPVDPGGASFGEKWAFEGYGMVTPLDSHAIDIESVSLDRSGPQAAMSFSFSEASPVSHRTRVTHRVFNGQQVAEYVFTQESLEAGVSLTHAATPSNGKYLYWKNSVGFDRGITDLGGDVALPAADSHINTNRYGIAYKNSSKDAIGLLSPFRDAKIRVDPGASYGRISDLANKSSDGTSVRLIHGVGKKDTLAAVFESLAAGVTVSVIEEPGFAIEEPGTDEYFIVGEVVAVRVTGSDFSGLTAQFVRPDASTQAVSLSSDGGGAMTAPSALVVDGSTQKGTWTLEVTSSFGTATRSFVCLDPVSGADLWTYPSRGFRREVVLPADPSSARTDVAVFVDLCDLEGLDTASVKVDEVTSAASNPLPIHAVAYAQPSGKDPRAFWVAPGSTAAGLERRFLLYYNKTASPVYAYDMDREGGGDFGSRTVVQTGSTGSERFEYNLKGSPLDFRRTSRNVSGGVGDPYSGVAFYEKNSAGMDWAHLQRSNGDFSAFNGVRLTYAFGGFDDAIAFNEAGNARVFDSLEFDRNGPTLAMCATYDVDEQIPHTTEVSHRLFEGVLVLEFIVSVTPDVASSSAFFSTDYFAARQFYWKDSFVPTRMVTDLSGDQALAADNDSKNWTIIYEDSTDEAVGLFSFRKSKIRAQVSQQSLQSYYPILDDLSCRLYYATGTRAELVELFTSMKRGYVIGAEQLPSFNVFEPLEGAHFIPGEAVEAVVQGPEIGSDLTLRIDYPDGSQSTLSPSSPGALSHVFDLGTVNGSSKFGTWVLTAQSGGVSRSRTFEVLQPQHPRVLFTASELAGIRSRWSANPSYYESMFHSLELQAVEAYSNIPPATVSGSTREYQDDLLVLATLLLRDSSNPAYAGYRARMWENFDTIIHWPEWSFSPAFSFSDLLERGELLQAMICVYDWHYADLSVAEARAYAELLSDHADSVIDLGYANTLSFDPRSYKTIDGNKHILSNAVLAGAAQLLKAEMPAERYERWSERSSANFDLLKRVLTDDGTNHEGTSYNTGTNISLLFWAEALRLGGDSNVYSSAAWFQNAPYYELYAMMPGRVGNFGGLLPFGNTTPTPYGSHRMTMGLFAQRLDDGAAQWVAENSDYSRVESFQPFWQSDLVTAITPSVDLPNWRYFKDRGIFVFRSSWADDATYFAAKCGPHWGGHEHPDAGTFIVHRNGFPYIASNHYMYGTLLKDENIMTVGDYGLRGGVGVAKGFSLTTTPAEWGSIDSVLASPDYFNLLADPTAAYVDSAGLESYKREFVGFGDFIVLRDKMAATAAASFALSFHAYKTFPQTQPSIPYDPNARWTADPFKYIDGHWRLRPNSNTDDSEWMLIWNLSRDSWSTGAEDSMIVPAKNPETSASNEGAKAVFQRGQRLEYLASPAVASASSVLALSFRDATFVPRQWEGGAAHDGVVLEQGGAEVLKVVWPEGGSLSASEGLTVTAEMAVCHYELNLWGGRGLSYLKDASVGDWALIESDQPVRIRSSFHTTGEAWVATDQPTRLTLYDPTPKRWVVFDGRTYKVDIAGQHVSVTLPARPNGAKLLATDTPPPARVSGWGFY